MDGKKVFVLFYLQFNKLEQSFIACSDFIVIGTKTSNLYDMQGRRDV